MVNNLTPPAPRRELGLIAALTLVGAVLRAWNPARLGLTHFDEGIYALAGLWSLGGSGLAGLSPTFIAYAPPGYPILVGLSYLVLGPSDLAAIAVSQLAGVAVIPATAWLGRRLLGPGAGAASAAFAALSGPHVVFSRMALTDASFLLAWLMALGLGLRFLERTGVARAIVFGLAVGAAQNLKYNGWLAGLIVAATATLDLIRSGEQKRAAARSLGYGLIAAAVAAGTYWPWFRFVEFHGGYDRLAAHQRGYLGGPGSWLPHLRQQLAQVVALSGGAAWLVPAWVGACLAGVIGLGGWEEDRQGSRTLGDRSSDHGSWLPSPSARARFLMPLLIGAAALALAPDLPWWLGLAWAPWGLRSERTGPRLLATWWLILSILTPFYHPYARLWLPLHAAGWLMMGATVTQVPNARLDARWLAILGVVALAIGHDWLSNPRPRPLSRLLAPTDSLQAATARVSMDRTLPAQSLRLLTRPTVRFYLVLSDRFRLGVAERAESLLPALPFDPWCLVEEEQLRQEGDPERLLARLLESYEVVDEYPVEPGRAAWLDLEPSAAYGRSARGADRLWLMKIRARGHR